MMKGSDVWSAEAGSQGPPDQKGEIFARGHRLAANDNSPGGRRVTLRQFQSVPMLLDEIAVIDRLMQELPAAANDNSPVA